MDAQFAQQMRRGRGRHREPRRADALHPHLDSSLENPNDFWGSSCDDDSSPDPFDHALYGDEADQPAQAEEEEAEQEQESSDDSEGTYATPQWTNETPTFEEDLTWEQEDLEEEARERDEVTSVSPEDVRQLARPSVVNPQPPPWRTQDSAAAAAGDDDQLEEPRRSAPNPMFGRSWLWGQDDNHELHPDDPSNTIVGKGR
eukprot:2487463-Amphidinium_carterae.1